MGGLSSFVSSLDKPFRTGASAARREAELSAQAEERRRTLGQAQRDKVVNLFNSSQDSREEGYRSNMSNAIQYHKLNLDRRQKLGQRNRLAAAANKGTLGSSSGQRGEALADSEYQRGLGSIASRAYNSSEGLRNNDEALKHLLLGQSTAAYAPLGGIQNSLSNALLSNTFNAPSYGGDLAELLGGLGSQYYSDKTQTNSRQQTLQDLLEQLDRMGAA